MKILALTAGAAGMYCGTCLRDNTLASHLLDLGHDVILAPVYTPTLTDERNVSRNRVLFGGVNVYLQQHVPFFRHTPASIDRLLDSPKLLNAVSGRSIPTDPKVLGEMTVAMLRGEDGNLRKEFQKLREWLKSESPPDIVDLPYTLLIAMARPIKHVTGRPVCCTLQGESLFLDGLTEPYRAEALALIRQNVPHVDAFIAVSEFYAEFMAEYLSIPRAKIHVVRLGIDLNGHGAPSQPRTGAPKIGYFARIAPEKGLHVLAEAFKLLRRDPQMREVQLECAGFLPAEHKGYLEKIEQGLRDEGLAHHFTYHGTPDRAGKIRFFHSVDVFSVPATYDEPKGLSIMEALANGLPVVLPARGAFPEIINRTGGGVLVPPGDTAALAHALHTLIVDRDRARRLGREGSEGVRHHYNAADMARRTLDVYTSVVSPNPSRVHA
jgi:glycosyltransferase involved in cell wall biosynthesis